MSSHHRILMPGLALAGAVLLAACGRAEEPPGFSGERAFAEALPHVGGGGSEPGQLTSRRGLAAG
jgi:hypothetical protein